MELESSWHITEITLNLGSQDLAFQVFAQPYNSNVILYSHFSLKSLLKIGSISLKGIVKVKQNAYVFIRISSQSVPFAKIYQSNYFIPNGQRKLSFSLTAIHSFIHLCNICLAHLLYGRLQLTGIALFKKLYFMILLLQLSQFFPLCPLHPATPKPSGNHGSCV